MPFSQLEVWCELTEHGLLQASGLNICLLPRLSAILPGLAADMSDLVSVGNRRHPAPTRDAECLGPGMPVGSIAAAGIKYVYTVLLSVTRLARRNAIARFW